MSQPPALLAWMSSLKPILKIAVPVRDRPRSRWACSPCVARPGSPLLPKTCRLCRGAGLPAYRAHIGLPTRPPRPFIHGPNAGSSSPHSVSHPAVGTCA